MAWFQISDFQRVRMEWLIEAQDEESAREKFLSSEGQTFIVTQSVAAKALLARLEDATDTEGAAHG